MENTGPIETYWTLEDEGKQSLMSRLEGFSGYLVSYNVAAEARALLSLGVDPLQFKWIDLMVEWKAIQNCNDEYLYGRYFDKWGKVRYSDPGERNEKLERINQKDKTVIGVGLADAVGRLLGVDLGKVYKGDSIGLILSRADGAEKAGIPYAEDEKTRILEYCASDIKYLRDLWANMLAIETKLWNLPIESKLLPAIVSRAEYNVCMAYLEQEGFPIDHNILENLTKNYSKIAEDCYKTVNDTYHIFDQTVKCAVKEEHKAEFKHYVTSLNWWPKTPSGKPDMKASTIGKNYDRLPKEWLGPLFKGKWTKKAKNVEALIEDKAGNLSWPKTDAGAYKTDEKTLKEFSFIPEIETLRKNVKILTQIKWFRPAAAPDLYAKIGNDGNIRPYYNPYGAQSGRNQPPAKSYPLLWSSWLRCIVRPKPGYSMITADFGSQEFIVAAALANDKNMEDAYDSGDPYLAFGKLAGAIPENGTKDTHEKERTMFKSTVLGLQYGMGAKKLQAKLSADMGETIDIKRTYSLINMHKKAFKTMWEWLEDVNHHYFTARKPLILGHNMADRYSEESSGDLWPVNLDNPSALSIKNVPVQGVSASILRESVKLACRKGLPMFAPLHDAVYLQCRDEDVEEVSKILTECMDEASIKLIGRKIRIDLDVYPHDKLYVPKKGKKEFDRLKHFVLDEKTSKEIE
jgi:DNA polymerase I-like protein with 3'-5' exonuclease and polymerase domains